MSQIPNKFLGLLTMIEAILYGLVTTIICMIPCQYIGHLSNLRYKKFLIGRGVVNVDELSNDEKSTLDEEFNFSQNGSSFNKLFTMSLILVYPSIIGNAIFRLDLLKPWFIFACCFLTYSLAAFFII